MHLSPPPVIGIVGWKKSGKTTLTVALVAEFTRRGYRVATVKHAHHDFQIDEGTTDSARHRQAGAAEVCVIGGKRWAIIHELGDAPEPPLSDVLAMLSPADLVVVEGYKAAPIPKIEVRSLNARDHARLSADDPHILAIASDDAQPGETLPVFPRNSVAALADFVAERVGLGIAQSVAKS